MRNKIIRNFLKEIKKTVSCNIEDLHGLQDMLETDNIDDLRFKKVQLIKNKLKLVYDEINRALALIKD